jgi:hypothetical protein
VSITQKKLKWSLQNKRLTKNAGEYQIAQAFSQTLFNNFGIGTSELVIPANLPVRPINIPTNFRAVSSPQGITVTVSISSGLNNFGMISTDSKSV